MHGIPSRKGSAKRCQICVCEIQHQQCQAHAGGARMAATGLAQTLLPAMHDGQNSALHSSHPYSLYIHT